MYRNKSILNIDYRQRGIGTQACGLDTLDKYKLLGSKYKFEFSSEVI